jgi:hypothetical protein
VAPRIDVSVITAIIDKLAALPLATDPLCSHICFKSIEFSIAASLFETFAIIIPHRVN